MPQVVSKYLYDSGPRLVCHKRPPNTKGFFRIFSFLDMETRLPDLNGEFSYGLNGNHDDRIGWNFCSLLQQCATFTTSSQERKGFSRGVKEVATMTGNEIK